MRYTKEFKLECIKKHMAGVHIDEPGGCKRETFMVNVRNWCHIYENLGEAGLEHLKPLLSLEDKYLIIQRIESGESMRSIANTIGRQTEFVSRLYKSYLQEGFEGLQSHHRKGRPPKMKKKYDVNVDLNSLSIEEQNKILRQQLEEKEIEVEYLKKLNALVQKRKAQQLKKK